MTWWRWLISLFHARHQEAGVGDIRLNAVSEAALGLSLRQLSPGQRGWITIAEARQLFSSERDGHGLTEWDEPGIHAVNEFAAQKRSTARRQGDRVIFTRQ
jgi:hypothetical protein